MRTALPRPKPTPFADFMDASPLLSRLALALLAAFVVTTMLAFIDPRLLNGVSVWEKPAKFYLSLAVHTATLNWGLMLLAPSERTAPAIRRTALIAAIAAVGEMIWITLQAARGQASHFNDTAAMYQIMYALMGAGAVTLTGITIYLGFRILTRGNGIATYAAGTGFILAGILTTAVAGYLSQQTGHAVGGDATDASGLPFFHWSTTGGDLRVAHFAALHVAQAIPFLAWIWPDRRIINLGLFASVVIVGALLAQAMAGIPFLRA